MRSLTPIFAVALDVHDNCEQMYGQMPAEYDCVLEGLCGGLALKYNSIFINSNCLVRFLIEDLDLVSEQAVRGFLSGLDAKECEPEEAFEKMRNPDLCA